ncbi:hypothetical protein SISSUDRAFT_995013 [Sistotremastrum suecicum HHB10207 ss-3]|uniref:Uncharacterized protein n=1 Tax=Sistotremastrum suecicum HHB10207 ss-3 TaxID=1314776 RepID=A0A165WU78_9AGAM|nr:hypothetical protein SISSUDRAFT_995013 [Sistotremastrum suecicum HHB10207 ss-3]
MHLISLNIPDIFLKLWRGQLACAHTDNINDWPWRIMVGEKWKEHGALVAAAHPYLPGSFDRTPRNPAFKVSSGYKAWEFLIWFYCLGPCLFYDTLPFNYWRHFCLGVSAFRLLMQEKISPEDIKVAHRRLLKFAVAFEELYYQRRRDRLHFVRPSVHAVVHLALETARMGPLLIYSQWAIERTIGNLGEEIKQDSNPYANLARRGYRRTLTNTLLSIFPHLNPPPTIKGTFRDLGQEYYMLGAIRQKALDLSAQEATLVSARLLAEGDTLGARAIYPWARLKLPNGQISRALWKENETSVVPRRYSRNVKVGTGRNREEGVALISRYGPPNPFLLRKSYGTYETREYRGMQDVCLVSAKDILSVVMMAPDPIFPKYFPNDESRFRRYYLAEKPGLQVANIMRAEADDPNADD